MSDSPDVPAADELPEGLDPSLREAVLEGAANPMFVADRAGRIRWVNAAFSRLYGYTTRDLRGQTPRVLKSGRQSPEFYEQLWRTIGAGEVWNGQLVNRRRSGELVDVEQTVTPVRAGDGRITHFLAVYEDITHRLHSEQSIARLAMFDSLTGLANRNQFLRRMTEALARSRRNAKAIGVMLLDLDHFKRVNDTLGHAAGDALLAQVAQRMPPCLRESDTVARISGDEFAVLIEDLVRPEQAVESAQRLLDAIMTPCEVQGISMKIGASIGIALSGAAGDTPESLLHHADMAMYQAKSAGRARYQFFDAAMDAAARRRYKTEIALRAALREDQLRMVYQPQVRLDTGEIVGAEALLRWSEEELGPVPPMEFVGLAEQSGLIVGLNDWVLRRVIQEVADARARCARFVPVAINLSSGHFEKIGLASTLERMLAQYQLPGSAIRVEITETVMLQPSLTVHENFRGLARLGVAIGVDDFGMGYSSLPSLREFPVSYIKLDRSYVKGIGNRPRDEQLLRGMIGLAHSLHLDVIAEGVETPAQAGFLLDQGCPQGQGFLYAEGVPIAELLARIDGDGKPGGESGGGATLRHRLEARS